MPQVTLKRGDTTPELSIALDGLEQNLDENATVQIYVGVDPDLEEYNRQLLVNQPADRIKYNEKPPEAVYDLQPGDTSIAGEHLAEAVVTFGDGEVQTVPERDYISLTVTEPTARDVPAIEWDPPDIEVGIVDAQQVNAPALAQVESLVGPITGGQQLTDLVGENLAITNGALDATDTDTQLTDEQVQDVVGAFVGAAGAASVDYDDSAGTLTVSATDTDTQLSASEVQDVVESYLAGGENVQITASSGTLTIAADHDHSGEALGGSSPLTSINSEEGLFSTLDGIADYIVSSTSELQSAFATHTAGEVIWIARPATPYLIDDWLSLDADAAVIGESWFAENGEPMIKVADGANVGGIQVGTTTAPDRVVITGVGIDGNHINQTSGVEHHGIDVRDAANVTIHENYVERTHPYQDHGEGGSGISVLTAQNAWITHNRVDEAGDRSIEFGGQNAVISENICTNSWDRHISTLIDHYTTLNGAIDTQTRATGVTISDNILVNSTEGSAIGVQGLSGDADKIVVTGNVASGPHNSLATIMPNTSNLVISNNSGDGSEASEHGINVSMDTTPQSGFSITGNTLYNYPSAGIRTSAGATQYSVANNILLDNNIGMRIQGDEGSIVGNIIDGSLDLGARVDGSDNTLIGNSITRSVSTGLAAQSGTNNVFAFNTIKGNKTGTTGAHTTDLSGGSNSWIGNVIDSSNGGGGPFYEQSDGNLVALNRFIGGTPNLNGPNTTVLQPDYDVHRGVSDGDSNNTISVTFAKPYATRPQLAFGRRAGGISAITYQTNASGNYSSVDLTVGTAGGVADVFVGGR